MNRLILLLALGCELLSLATKLSAADADLIWRAGKVVTVNELCAVRDAIAANVLGGDDQLRSLQADKLAATTVRQTCLNSKLVDTRDQGECRSSDAGATNTSA